MDSVTPADLSGVPLLSGLADGDLAVLAPWFDVERHDAGHVLVREGQAGYAFYIVGEGEVEVTVQGEPVRRLGPGDYFGEIAILGQGRRTATVTTATACTVWVLFGTRFRELERDHSVVAAALTAAME